jgi:hypothetical protein
VFLKGDMGDGVVFFSRMVVFDSHGLPGSVLMDLEGISAMKFRSVDAPASGGVVIVKRSLLVCTHGGGLLWLAVKRKKMYAYDPGFLPPPFYMFSRNCHGVGPFSF